MMTLEHMMTTGVVTVSPDDTTTAARAEMRRHRTDHLVVIDRRRVVGIVSRADLDAVRRAKNRTVRDVMSTDVVSASATTTLREASERMRGHSMGHVLVMDGKRPVALVTTTDLLAELDRRPPAERRARRARRGPAERNPLPTTVPRPAKLTRDRTSTLPPPAHIRVLGARVADKERDQISRKLGRKLGKFASAIERVTVRLSDANGPKGGRDQVCRIKVVISGLPSVVVEERDATLQRAVERAIDAITVAVRRSVQRRRMKPLREEARTRARPTASA